MQRFIVLDTETTGLNRNRNINTDVCHGHRVVEIACVEIIGSSITGRRFHRYVQPDRDIDPKAVSVHGITDEFLKGKPRFHDIVGEFLDFIKDDVLVIHNAPFDIAFIDQEFSLLPKSLQPTGKNFTFIDTLTIARDRFPYYKNDLNSLCDRYEVGGRSGGLHGALEDTRMLALVFLKMIK